MDHLEREEAYQRIATLYLKVPAKTVEKHLTKQEWEELCNLYFEVRNND